MKNMSFGKNLQYLRQLSANMTQETLAEKLNVSRQTISKWEQGLSVPDAEMLINISEVFETTVSDLIVENGVIKGVKIKEAKYAEDEEHELTDVYADKVVLAVGRKGANWLVDMCKKLPTTLSEMLEVSGVGSVKLNMYGDRFLQVLRSYNNFNNKEF